jgi:glutamate-ammonia-ligase adenylyltransferase
MPQDRFTQATALARRFSRYVDDQLDRRPGLLDADDLAPLNAQQLASRLARDLPEDAEEERFSHLLRLVRHRHMVRIAVRDLAGIAPLEETMADTSALADQLIGAAQRWAMARLVARYGLPMGEGSAKPQSMIVLGMGKLGGGELNFSSDIDLIFAFGEDGETQGGDSSISNGEFFAKLGQTMNNALAATTADGFVYRVDMRLRPFGKSGELAQSFASMEQYYQLHGRPWERHALVKARALTGGPEAVQQLDDILRPFVYRRYADFSMLDSLRDLKRMIVEDAERKGSDGDIKLGAGGIRDVEFIVQSFQLVHGGRDATLRERSLLKALRTLTARGYLGEEAGRDLEEGYIFLRAVENRLQMWNDEQTHSLPADPEQLRLLAESMGFSAPLAFKDRLGRHRTSIRDHFDQVLGATPPLRAAPEPAAPPPTRPEGWRRHLDAFAQSPAMQAQSATDRERLDAVLPLILDEIATSDVATSDVDCLERVLTVLTSVLRRSVYLVLLKESPSARALLVNLCAASPWAAATLAQTPDLLDQLIDPRQLFDLPGRAMVETELRLQTDQLRDDEDFLNALRNFKRAQVFKVAACDLTGRLPLMKVSDHLTWIAEAEVIVALDRINRKMEAAHGRPAGWEGEDVPYLIVAFGKLGGLELGYGSDLDMVFLSPDLPAEDMSAGPHRLENAIYFTRMGQRLMSALNTQLASGVVYEVDTQLRPHGKSGMLVNTLDGFFDYERRQAWVWEHQALLRTRAIAGAPELMAKFETQRRDFLCLARDSKNLAREVLSMRARMQEHLDHSDADTFDIKQGRGGMIDVEFLVQYLCLRDAHDHPEVIVYSDNVRQLEALAQVGSLSNADAQTLTDAYKFWRGHSHRLALGEAETIMTQAEAKPWADKVLAIWSQVFDARA